MGQGTGEGSVGFSLFCSGFCMLIVALPLLTADPSNFGMVRQNISNRLSIRQIGSRDTTVVGG